MQGGDGRKSLTLDSVARFSSCRVRLTVLQAWRALLPEGTSLAVPARAQRAHEQHCASVLSLPLGLSSVFLAVLRGSRG